VKTETFVRRSRIPAPAAAVFDWHAREGAFARLSPPWQSVELISTTGGIDNGARTEFYLKAGPFRRRWIAEHGGLQPGRQFHDVQIAGPFASWKHTHIMTPDGENACVLEDRIEYALPGGIIGRGFAGGMVRRDLERAFRYRHELTAHDVCAHQAAGNKVMKILVSGSSGLVGGALTAFLTTGGHEVLRLVRKSSEQDNAILWNPSAGQIDRAALEGIEAVVHLAGEGIATRRWSVAQKARILDSRVQGTRLLCEAITELETPPQTFVCASAVGFYGDRGEETLDETSGVGTGFLADVCQQWEAACEPAREKGIRVVNLRTGMVLSPQGGALKSMLLPFKMCVGGVVGAGKQFWSWIALDDLVGAIHHALTCDDLSGPVNATAPNSVTNREFTKTLGKVLRRPTIFPMPAFAARLALGEMADELLLPSVRAQPKRLQETGYEFRYPDLEGALRHVLGR
jgi:uncharacterized protein (TIGR01777 family)